MPHRQRSAGTEMYNTLRGAILNGSLRSGEYLAGTPDLRRRFGISNDTAQRVLTRLAEEKLIIRRNGCPTRIAELPPERRTSPASIGLYLPRMGGAMNPAESPMHFQVIQSLLTVVAGKRCRLPLFPASPTGYDFAGYGLDGLIVFSPTPREREEMTRLRASGVPLLLLEASDLCWNGFHRLSTDRMSAFREAMERFARAGRRQVVFFDGSDAPVGHVRQMAEVWQDALRRWAVPERSAARMEELAGAEAVFAAYRPDEAALRRVAPDAMVIGYSYTRQFPDTAGFENICHGTDFFDRALTRMLEIIAAPLQEPRSEWFPAEFLTFQEQPDQ